MERNICELDPLVKVVNITSTLIFRILHYITDSKLSASNHARARAPYLMYVYLLTMISIIKVGVDNPPRSPMIY